jgi:hypothetical protein
MTSAIAIPPLEKINLKSSPVVRSYDTGFEHSVEHLLSVRQLVAEAESEPVEMPRETALRGIAAD